MEALSNTFGMKYVHASEFHLSFLFFAQEMNEILALVELEVTDNRRDDRPLEDMFVSLTYQTLQRFRNFHKILNPSVVFHSIHQYSARKVREVELVSEFFSKL